MCKTRDWQNVYAESHLLYVFGAWRSSNVSSNFSEYLQIGTEVIGAIQAGVKLGEVVLPYLRPLIVAAAL